MDENFHESASLNESVDKNINKSTLENNNTKTILTLRSKLYGIDRSDTGLALRKILDAYIRENASEEERFIYVDKIDENNVELMQMIEIIAELTLSRDGNLNEAFL